MKYNCHGWEASECTTSRGRRVEWLVCQCELSWKLLVLTESLNHAELTQMLRAPFLLRLMAKCDSEWNAQEWSARYNGCSSYCWRRASPSRLPLPVVCPHPLLLSKEICPSLSADWIPSLHSLVHTVPTTSFLSELCPSFQAQMMPLSYNLAREHSGQIYLGFFTVNENL